MKSNQKYIWIINLRYRKFVQFPVSPRKSVDKRNCLYLKMLEVINLIRKKIWQKNAITTICIIHICCSGIFFFHTIHNKALITSKDFWRTGAVDTYFPMSHISHVAWGHWDFNLAIRHPFNFLYGGSLMRLWLVRCSLWWLLQTVSLDFSSRMYLLLMRAFASRLRNSNESFGASLVMK